MTEDEGIDAAVNMVSEQVPWSGEGCKKKINDKKVEWEGGKSQGKGLKRG